MSSDSWTVVTSKKEKKEKKQTTQPVRYFNLTAKTQAPSYGAIGAYTVKSTIEKKQGQLNSQSTSVNARKIEQNAEEGIYQHKKVSYDLKMQIQKARQAKNMTQKQVAEKCQLPVQVIKNYEAGIGIPNSEYLTLIGRVLGVTFKR